VIRRSTDSPLSEQYFYHCPHCGDLTEFTGANPEIKPFWQNLPKILRYPLNRTGMLVVLGLPFVGWGCAATQTQGHLLLHLVFNLLGLVLLAIAVTALQATAGGDLKFTGFNRFNFKTTVLRSVQHYLLYMMIGLGCILACIKVGAIAGIAFLFAGVMYLPAAVITLTQTESGFQLLIPYRVFTTAKQIGKPYPLLVALLFLLMVFPMGLGLSIQGCLPAKMHLLLFGIAQSYMLLVMYHLIGYAIFQYRYKMEGHGADGIISTPWAHGFPRESLAWHQDLLERVNLIVAADKPDEAIELIQNATAVHKFDDLELSARYYELLESRNRYNAIERHVPRHLWLLIKAGKRKEACSLYREMVAKDPEFSPHPTQLFELASWLAEEEPPLVALGTFQQLVRSHPNDPLVPKAYFRIAQILNNQLMEPSRAKSILKRLLTRYPDHEIIPKVKRYLVSVHE
jgi:tetratricopeptide (TPR) repeat protein